MKKKRDSTSHPRLGARPHPEDSQLDFSPRPTARPRGTPSSTFRRDPQLAHDRPGPEAQRGPVQIPTTQQPRSLRPNSLPVRQRPSPVIQLGPAATRLPAH
ncbi:hypothetical protein CRG98_012151 [Punica granatum]|uniref:Uncharacterized protein n=1 Tax=Punica granatum TaxID=22663 RepID=A0A2I0KGD7_PUNGR|nr:hypothetical protein CRG98_012151 [Punica granatum]